MPPRRSVRRNSGSAAAIFKKGDLVKFTINGSSVKGKIVRKSTKGSATSPIWIVNPDGRRRTEEIQEKDLLILNETAPSKSKRLGRSSTGGTASSYSDDSLEDPVTSRRSTRGSGTGTGSSEEHSESSKKRKSDESDTTTTSNNKSRKVTFSEGKRAALAAAKKKKAAKKKPAGRAGNISTRSTRASGGELMSELPPASKPNKPIKVLPKLKKNENVKVIKMLTGTLYLYRGETRRVEFVRSKY